MADLFIMVEKEQRLFLHFSLRHAYSDLHPPVIPPWGRVSGDLHPPMAPSTTLFQFLINLSSYESIEALIY